MRLNKEQRTIRRSTATKIVGAAGLAVSLGGLIRRMRRRDDDDKSHDKPVKVTKTAKKKAKKAKKKLRKAAPLPH